MRASSVFFSNNAKGKAVPFGVKRGVGQDGWDDVLVAVWPAIIVVVHEGFEFVPRAIIENGKGSPLVRSSVWKVVAESAVIADTLETIVCKGVRWLLLMMLA